MTSRPRLWFSTSFEHLQFCFVCGGGLKERLVPADKKKRLVCASCWHIAYTNPKPVAGLIPVMPDGRVALLRRRFEPAIGKWSNPAGYQELGETVADAAVRETREEICTKATLTKLLGVYSYVDSSVMTVVYVGNVPRGQRPRPGREAVEVEFFKPDEIPWKDLAFRSTIDALTDWVRSRPGRHSREGGNPGCKPAFKTCLRTGFPPSRE